MNKLLDVPLALTFDDVLLVPRYSSIKSRSNPEECDTSWALSENRYGQLISFKFSHPVIPANMDSVTELKMMGLLAKDGGLAILHRRLSIDKMTDIINSFRSTVTNKPLAVSVGSVINDKARIDYLLELDEADIICIDIAHGHSIHMKETLEYIRASGFKGPVIAGNVCRGNAVEDLHSWGASMIKVGVGPGSVCTTRIKTGCGYPQLQAVADCAARGWPVIADGGIRHPDDAAKALAAGATAVMVGGMLAGTDCVPGWAEAIAQHDIDLLDWRRRNPTYSQAMWAKAHELPSITYRGMASKEAKEAVGEPGINVEGAAFTVKCKEPGSTQSVIMNVVEGIRGAMSYTGCRNLDEFRKETEFVRMTNTTENYPHFEDK